MKCRFIIAGVVCAIVLACFVTLRTGTTGGAPAIRATIGFVGFTNGIMGAQEPIVSMLERRQAAVLQRWFDGGTNAAIFTITNHQDSTVLISAHGQLFTKGTPGLEHTFLLHPTGFPDFFLGPHQEISIGVPMLQQQGPWKLRLTYHRDSREYTLPEQLKRSLRKMINGRPTGELSQMVSDWIESMPPGQTPNAEKPAAP